MPRFIYGDTYGDVAGRQLAYDAARDSRLFQSLAAQRANRQQDFAEQLAQAEADNRLNQALANQAFQQQQLGTEEDLQRERQRDTRQANDRTYEIHLKNLLANQEFAKQQHGDQDFAEALNLAQQGALKPAEVAALYGDRLRPEQQNAITNMVKNLAAQEDQFDAGARSLADNLNQRLKIQRTASAYTEAQKTAKTPEEALANVMKMATEGKLPDLTPVQKQMFLNSHLDNRSSKLVTWDAETGEFRPVLSPRRFSLEAPAGGAGGPAKAAGAVAKPADQTDTIAQMVKAGAVPAQAAFGRILATVTPGKMQTPQDEAAVEALTKIGMDIGEATRMVIDAKLNPRGRSKFGDMLRFAQRYGLLGPPMAAAAAAQAPIPNLSALLRAR